MRNVSIVLIVVFLAACVTETTGGLTPAAEDGVRLKAQLDLARGYFASEDWTRARGPLNRALEIDQRSVEAYVLLAILSQREGELELAESHLRVAARYNNLLLLDCKPRVQLPRKDFIRDASLQVDENSERKCSGDPGIYNLRFRHRRSRCTG